MVLTALGSCVSLWRLSGAKYTQPHSPHLRTGWGDSQLSGIVEKVNYLPPWTLPSRSALGENSTDPTTLNKGASLGLHLVGSVLGRGTMATGQAGVSWRVLCVSLTRN